MRQKVLIAGLTGLGVLAFAGALFGQSLGEVARQERAKREREKPAPTKVWTNDNIPRASTIESAPPSVQPAPPAAETAPPSAEAAPPSATSSGAAPSKEDKKQNKDYWQGRFKAARAELAGAKERQQLVEDELNLLQIQEIRELDPAAKKDLEDKVAAKQNAVDQARTVTEKAQKALDDLQKEFDDSGAPAEWSKTD